MSLVGSLLGAIVRLNGDSLVLHVGEKPYVVTSPSAMRAFRGPLEWGQVELSTRVLTVDAVNSMLDQLLTAEQRQTLDEIGAVDRELPATAELPAFTVIAARGGDDIWLEVRPVKLKAVAPPEPEVQPQPAVPAEETHAAAEPAAPELPDLDAAEPHVPAPASFEIVPDIEQEQPDDDEVMQLLASAGLLDHESPHITVSPEHDLVPEVDWAPLEDDVDLIESVDETPDLQEQIAEEHPAEPEAMPEEEAPAVEAAAAGPEPQVVASAPESQTRPAPQLRVVDSESPAEAAVSEPHAQVAALGSVPELHAVEAAIPVPQPQAEVIAPAPQADVSVREAQTEAPMPAPHAEVHVPEPQAEVVTAAPQAEAAIPEPHVDVRVLEPQADALVPEPQIEIIVPEPEPSVAQSIDRPDTQVEAPLAPASEPEPARPAAVVVPMSRPPREPGSVSLSSAPVSVPDLDRLLRIAAARGASGLYLVAQSQPVVRVDGEMQQLDGEESLTAADVEVFTLALAPEPTREAVRTGATSEWFRDVPDLGRVRCLAFRDHRGPGVMIRMLPARAISVEQLGLSKEIQALCGQPEGLVLIAGARASGTSTLIAAFVDLVNRSRADHVITIERQISFVHESRRSFVSQREVRGEADELAGAVRTALREDPDVLVIEELRTADMIAAATEAAESGRLVFAGLRAPATVPALERLVEQFPAERRPHILTSLSASLRGVVGQVLLRKRGGGRIAARELLLNTPAVAALIAEGKLFQLPAALESGRKLGSVALNDALAALIRDGIVDAGEAWRKAYDREGLLTVLKREGIDTSFVERLA